VEEDRALHVRFVLIAARRTVVRGQNEYAVELPHTPNVVSTDGRHPHHFPID
jgi:hypothetical protein